MRTKDAIKEFGNNVRELAEALGITREAIYQWGENVPALRAYEIRDILAERCSQKLGAANTAPQPHEEAV